MFNMRTLLALLIACNLIGSVGSAAAQQTATTSIEQFRSMLEKMRQKHQGLEKIHIKMTVRVFEDISAAPFYTQKAEVMKDKGKYLYKFDGNELLMNERYLIMTDSKEKEIFCTARNPAGEKAFADPVGVNIDSLLAFYGTPRLIEVVDGIEHYRLIQEDNIVRQIDLHLNSDQGVMRKIEYRFEDGQLARIEFDLFDIQPTFAADDFDESEYVTITGNSIKPASHLATYRILNTEAEDESN
jgi:hypothetical protein